MTTNDSVTAMWDGFVAENPEAADATYSVWHFCDTQELADELVELVLAGPKRATAGLLWAYEVENEPVPVPGDYSVITNWEGTARCIIRSARVDVVPFAEVSAEFAATEGEGDGSLAYWRQVHEAAFSRELAGAGLAFDPSMPIVCEVFEVVFGDDDWRAEQETRHLCSIDGMRESIVEGMAMPVYECQDELDW